MELKCWIALFYSFYIVVINFVLQDISCKVAVKKQHWWVWQIISLEKMPNWLVSEAGLFVLMLTKEQRRLGMPLPDIIIADGA